MNAQTEMLVVPPGRREEALNRIHWMHGLMQHEPGFQEALVAKYLGDATRFLAVRFWRDSESQSRFHERFMREHAASRPPGLYTIEENYTCLCTSEREEPVDGEACFLVRTHRRVPDAVVKAFAEFAGGNEEMVFSFGGLAQYRRLESTGDGLSDVFNVYRYRSREDFERYFEAPRHEQRTHQWPEGVELVSTKLFEILSETGRRKIS